jgi:branched-chain amino acid transport system substrate-binding protein
MKSNELGAILILLTILLSGCSNNITGNHIEERPLKVGAILPMTGPGAIWGEPTRNGMELARQELSQDGTQIEIIYEDSQLSQTVGISAYNKLKQIDKVDAVATLASRIGIPLIQFADRDKTPLIMTITSAKGAAATSPYAFRFFTNEKSYVNPHFEAGLIEDKIAIIYINDEYGVSIKQQIESQAKKNNIQITAQETFEPSTTDFRSQLVKIKSTKPKTLLFVAATPIEVTNILKQAQEIELNCNIVETSTLLSEKTIRNIVGNSTENIHTDAFPFTLQQTGTEFRAKYKDTYNQDPTFASAFGYDIIKMLAKASNGKSVPGQTLKDNILQLKELDTLNGLVTIQPNGEINPELYSTKIVNNELELSKTTNTRKNSHN